MSAVIKFIVSFYGGKGSGHHGHVGVEGEYGGSAPSGQGSVSVGFGRRFKGPNWRGYLPRKLYSGFVGEGKNIKLKPSKRESGRDVIYLTPSVRQARAFAGVSFGEPGGIAVVDANKLDRNKLWVDPEGTKSWKSEKKLIVMRDDFKDVRFWFGEGGKKVPSLLVYKGSVEVSDVLEKTE